MNHWSFVKFSSRFAGCLSLVAAVLAPQIALAQSSPALSSGSSPVFVLNSLDASVSVIDPVTWTETRRIPTGKEPHHVYLTPDSKSLIVANSLGDSLLFIDPKSGEVQRTIKGILDPYQLRFSPDMKWFVTAANRLNHVDIYRWDGKDLTLAKRIVSSRTPSHIWIDSKSTTAFVSMQDSDEMVAVDLATQVIRWRTKTGPMPADIYGTADDKTLLLGLTGGNGVEVYDIDRRHVFVSNRVANTISKIDLQTLEVVARYPAPGGPDCMDVSADGKTLLVTSRWAKKLTVIDTESRKVVQQVKVGKSPHGVWTLDHAPR